MTRVFTRLERKYISNIILTFREFKGADTARHGFALFKVWTFTGSLIGMPGNG